MIGLGRVRVVVGVALQPAGGMGQAGKGPGEESAVRGGRAVAAQPDCSCARMQSEEPPARLKETALVKTKEQFQLCCGPTRS